MIANPFHLLNSAMGPVDAARIINALKISQQTFETQRAKIYVNLFANLTSFARQYPNAFALALHTQIDNCIYILDTLKDALGDKVYKVRRQIIESVRRPEQTYAIGVLEQCIDYCEEGTAFRSRLGTVLPICEYLKKAIPEFVVGELGALRYAQEVMVTDARMRVEAVQRFEGVSASGFTFGGSKL
ncbi:MAG: hypothetical protein Q9168_005520 [Polycauliona sp. 1 TL-2023]